MSTVPSPSFGALLRQYRLNAGLTQEELAECAHLSVEAVNTLERGTRRTPRSQTVRLLAEALGLSATERALFQMAAQQPSGTLQTQIAIGQLPTPLVLLRQPIMARRPLPFTSNSLIGREQEVQAICALIQRPEVHLLTVTGPGGTGKTRLALQVATDLSETFADGCCFVDLAPLSEAELVMPTIARALGIQEVPSQTPLESLTAALLDQQLLLLLDNFEQVIGAATAIASLVAACPHLTVVVTSREVLHLQAEYEFVVPPLAIPDLVHLPDLGSLAHAAAVELFLQRAQAVQPGFHLTLANAPSVVEICARLDGLPLALELAAARIKLLSPQDLLVRLDQQGQVLRSETRDVPLRQRTLHHTIAWSYQLLPSQEQRLFQRLAVFVGGCSLAAIEALSSVLAPEMPAGSLLDQLAALIDKSLLQRGMTEEGEPRFALLETLRAFGLECLAANGQLEGTRRAHADYYLHMVEEAVVQLDGPQHRVWLERLEREQENLRAALTWLHERGEAVLALRLARALGAFWCERGYWSEVRTWMERTLSNTPGEVSLVRSEALKRLGFVALSYGELDRAETYLHESLALARAIQAPKAMADALGSLGLLAGGRGHYAAADGLFEETVHLFREAGSKGNLVWLLSAWGVTALYQGDFASAHTRIEEALELSRTLGDRSDRTEALKALARVCLFEGNLAQASALAEECLVICTEEASFNLAEPLTLLGEIVLWQGDASRARALAEEGLAQAQEWNFKLDLVEALRLFGKVAAAQGNYPVARTAFEESLQIAREVGFQGELAPGLAGLAQVAAAEGYVPWAVRLWGVAEVLREQLGASLPPIERQRYEQAVTAARAHLGEATFAAAWAEGRQLTLDEALAPAN